MKKVKIYLSYVTFCAAFLLTSCSNDFLDVEPTDAVSEDLVASSAENLMAAINGMHRNMYRRQNDSQGQNGYGAQMISADVMGEDVILPTTGNGWFVSTLRWLHTDNESSSYVSYPWDFWYSMIRNANIIIANGAEAEGDPELINKALGEAHAYRAFGHFQLVQIFGKRYIAGETNDALGVVIRTDGNDNGAKPRATVQEVYDQVWADFLKAEELLEETSQDNNSHFSVNNVRGLMARVALVQQDYGKAASYAESAREAYSLMSRDEYKSGFNDYENGEWMWGIHVQEDQSDGFGNFMAYMSRNFSSTQIRTSPKVMNIKLYEAFPDSDVRKQLVDPTGLHEDLDLPSNFSKFEYTSQKFLAQSTSLSIGDVPFMRAAEMYLIEAEAKYQMGQEAASKLVLAELVSARDSEFTAFTTSGDAYYEEILVQRRMELWGEGFRLFDLKRLGRRLDRNDTNTSRTVINSLYIVEPDDTRWQWAIPRQELNANEEIVQNPI